MDSRKDNVERLLASLGDAHRDGIFESRAAGYPWQRSQAEAQSPGRRRFAWFWVGAPVAAAAAVAVLFVGPSLFPQQSASDLARTIQTNLLPEHPEVLADAATTNPISSDECDYNGDGVVNGEDIQALVARLQAKDVDGDPLVAVEQLQRCLLGG